MSFLRPALVLAGLLAASGALAAFSVDDASTRLEDGSYRVDADIDFGFSDEALEALDNGVPLTIVVEVKLEDDEAWFWERAPASRKLRYEMRYHPLAGLYSVVDLETGIQERFATKSAATVMLGTLRSVDLVRETQLKPGARYHVSLRAHLDIESLPLPLRPRAYISQGWHLSTGWKRWRLQR